jgi:hypothetical protein
VDSPLEAPEVREGWTLETGESTWTVRRDDPVEPAGGVTRTDGADVSDVTVRDTQVTFRVDAVDGPSGDVVLSRIDWPGYTVDGADLTDPTQGYLLTVEVTPDDVGETVTVTFRPPGWPVELAAGVLAVLVGVVWTGLDTARRLRTRTPGGGVSATE